MIKRIFITTFVLLFIISSTFASGLPITDNVNLKFNDIVGFKTMGDGYNLPIMSSNSFEYNGNIIYRNDRDMGKIYKKKISELNQMTPGEVFLERTDVFLNSTNAIITPDEQYILFMVNNMFYKKALNSTDKNSLGDLLINATSDGIDLNRSKIIGNYLYYTKNGATSGIYKKDLNSLDGSYGDNIMPGERLNASIIGEGFIVTFSMGSPSNMTLYDLTNSTQRNLGQFNPSGGMFNVDTNQSFVFGSSMFLYANQKIFKKDVTDADGIGVGDSNLFLDNVQMSRMSPNGKIISVKQDQSTYIKNVTDANNTPGTLWISNSQFLPGIDDKNNITNTSMYYVNGQGFYKKDFSDANTSSLGTKVVSKGNAGYLSKDGNTYIYDGGNQLYYIDLSNPKGFSKKDGFYRSDIRQIGAGKDNLYINVGGDVPASTSYIFSFTNNNNEINIANTYDVANNQINFGQDRIMNWGGAKTYNSGYSSTDLWNNTNAGDVFTIGGMDVVVSNKQEYGGGNFEIYFAGGFSLGLDQFGISNPTSIYKNNGTDWISIDTTNLNGSTEIKQSTIFGNTTENISYKIRLLTDDVTKTPNLSTVTISDAVINNVVPPTQPPSGNTNNTSTATGGIELNIGDGTAINIPAEKQTTDFIKSLATLPSINPSSLNSYSNVEKFLKDNNYDYKNQIVIGNGSIPDKTMYNVINLGLSNSSLSDTLSGAINSSDYSKLILNQDTYLAGKRIINYLGMDTADDDGNLIISVYDSDKGEYIFLKKKR